MSGQAALYEMTTGQRPFGGTTTALVFHEILAKVPPRPAQVHPGIGADVEHLLMRAHAGTVVLYEDLPRRGDRHATGLGASTSLPPRRGRRPYVR